LIDSSNLTCWRIFMNFFRHRFWWGLLEGSTGEGQYRRLSCLLFKVLSLLFFF
jgi:hypothetical protein